MLPGGALPATQGVTSPASSKTTRVVIDHAARRSFIGEERHGAYRHRVYKGAIITFNRGNSVFECLVRNQSNAGARLCMEQAFALPLSFNLGSRSTR